MFLLSLKTKASSLEVGNWMHAKKNEELAFVFGDDKNMTKTLAVDDEDDRAGNLGHQHYFQPNLAKGGLISKTFSHSLT